MSLTQSDWTYELNQGVLCITDLDLGRKSVTNDIDNVMTTLMDRVDEDSELIAPLKNNLVIYCDSDNNWDRVNVPGHKGPRFECLRHCSTKAEAVEYVLEVTSV